MKICAGGIALCAAVAAAAYVSTQRDVVAAVQPAAGVPDAAPRPDVALAPPDAGARGLTPETGPAPHQKALPSEDDEAPGPFAALGPAAVEPDGGAPVPGVIEAPEPHDDLLGPPEVTSSVKSRTAPAPAPQEERTTSVEPSGAKAVSDPILGGRTARLSASQLPRWSKLLSRHRATAGSAKWQAIVGRTAGLSGQELYSAANSTVNAVRYAPDRDDAWKAPADFIASGGDCEEYAIAKYLLLRSQNVPASRMRILMIPPGASEGHSVLVVETGSGPIVLDNKRSATYPLPRSLAASATYAFNDQGWWVNLDVNRQIARR